MLFPRTLIYVSAMPMLFGCASITGLQKAVYTSPPADLVADCDDPADMQVGDNITNVCIDNVARLQDCRTKHQKLADWTKGLSAQ